jgi:hypothetical protein
LILEKPPSGGFFISGADVVHKLKHDGHHHYNNLRDKMVSTNTNVYVIDLEWPISSFG